jgi:Na+/proline symporter
MAGIFAAIMSTTESLLLSSTSELSRNFMQKGIFINRNISEKAYSRIIKMLTIIIGTGGLLIAFYGSAGVFNMIIFAWTGLAASVGPAIIMGIYWKKCTSQGILAGILTGVPATSIWYIFFKASTGIHEGVSLIVPVIAVWLVSLFTQKVKQEEDWAEKLTAVNH